MDSIRCLLATWLLCQCVSASSWSHLPAIPTEPGRRAQYSLLLRQGGYKYGVDTGAGAWARQAGDAANRVTGAYQWRAPDGSTHGLQYTADENGFVPQPLPPSNAPSVDTSSSTGTLNTVDTSKSTIVQSSVGTSSTGTSVDTSKSTIVQSSVGTSSTGTSGITVDTSSSAFATKGGSRVTADASHSFTHNQQTSDAHTNVNVIGYHQLHNVHYSTGAGNGYYGAHIPAHTVYHQPIVPVLVHTHRLVPVVPVFPVSGHPPVVTPSHGGDEHSSGEEKGDPTYMFSYNTDTHSRDESSDAQGNVKGVFSFVDANGVRQTVEYESTNESGFVVKKVTSDTATTSTGNDDTQQTLIPVVPVQPPRQEPIPPQEPISPPEDFTAIPPQEPNQEHLPVNGLDEADDNSDASYFFSYNAGDHSREETSDSKGSITGSYTFVSKDDGATRRVDYTAGANQGFIAKGSHLPVANNDITISNSLLQGVAQPQPQALPVPLPLQNQGKAQIRPDGSYTFSYATNDHSRSETSDASGNVQGFYTVGSANGGNVRRIDYTAGAATGFVAIGDGVPPNVPVPAPNAVPVPVPVQPLPQFLKTTGEGSSSEIHGALDGSYAFGFQAVDHSREEAADSHNTVKGSYTFITKDDNINRRVDYIAGAKTGFIAKLSELNGQPLPKVSSETNIENSRPPASILSQTNSESSNEPAVITSQLSDESSGQPDDIKTPAQVTSDLDTSSQFSTTTPKPLPIIKSALHTSHVGTPVQPNLVLYTYLPPNSEKFGYILDTIH